MAGSLASSRSRIVGAIVPTVDNSIFSATVRALGERLAAAGYQLLLGQTNYEPKQEEALVAAFLGRRVDGLVLTGSRHSVLTRRRIREAAVPVVETWDLPAKPLDMVAGFSNLEAGRSVAQHFLVQGLRRLCFAGGPDERSSARLEGVRQAVAATPGARLQVQRLPAGAFFAGGCAVVQQLQRQHDEYPLERPQALFCGNDGLAAGALFECQRIGWAVPGQLAVMGFADTGMAECLAPRLSSVRVPMQEMGELAATMLLARLEGRQNEPLRCDLGFSLALRDTG
jgi:LacI family transcriptional regulator, gluconate utilization system Gnt-I transcriptional repressor